MTTINTIEDFLRILREDDELRSAVRREILTDELLELPQLVSSLAKSVELYKEATNQRFDMVINRLDEQEETHRQHKEDTDRRFDMVINRLDEQEEMHRQHKEDTDRRFDAVIKRLDEQEESTNQRFDMVIKRLDEQEESADRRFDMVVNRLDRQHEMYRRQHDDMGRFRGNYAIQAAHKSRYGIAREFARPRLMRRIEYKVLDGDTLNDMLNENYESLDTLGLSDDSLDSFAMADLVVEVAERRGSRPSFYIVVEASFTLGDRDITRAAERARILRCATGMDAYAVVASVRLDPANIRHRIFDDPERFIDANAENAAFWYPLIEDDLEPLAPR